MNRSFFDLLFSFAERIVPRLSSAVVLLGLAVLTSPATVGVFTWALVGVTLYRAIAENPIRNIATESLGTPQLFSYLSSTIARATWIGTAGLLVCTTVIAILSAPRVGAGSFVVIALTVIPIIISFSVVPLARLHRAHVWSSVASFRLVSSVVSVLVAAPFLFTEAPLAASVTFLIANDAVFAMLCVKRVRNLEVGAQEARPEGYVVADGIVALRREYRSSAFYQVLGWSESQVDRILIGAIAGTATLGQYSTSTSISRSGADAVAGGTARVLRARLATDSNAGLLSKRIADKTILPGALLVFSGCLAVWGLNAFVLPKLLGTDWAPTLEAIPIIAVGTLPAFLTWNISTMLAVEGRLTWLLRARIVGIVGTLPIALVAFVSFENAAWLLLLREFTIAMVAIMINRRNLSARLLSTCVLLFGILMGGLIFI